MTEPTPQYNTSPKQPLSANGHWLTDTVAALTEAGWRCLPAGHIKGRLQPLVPWKKDEGWYPSDHPKWSEPDVSMVAVQPPYDVVFLDADCYKDGAATWHDLEKVTGRYPIRLALFQKSLEKDSFHFVYRVPPDHNIKNCADSIPQLPHLDVRTTDGLIYVKPSKQLFVHGLHDVPLMPAELLELMPRNDNDRAYRQVNASPLTYTGAGLCDYLQSRGYEYRGPDGGAQTFDHPNSHSLSGGVRVMLVDGVEKVWSFQSDPLSDDHWHDLASAMSKLEPCENGLAFKALQRAEGDWRRALDLLPEIAREREQRQQAKEPPPDHPAFAAPHSVDEPQEVRPKKYEGLTLEEICEDLGVTTAKELAENAQPPEWIVKGILDSDCIGFMGGQSGAMKTFVALELMHCIATNRDFFGHPIKKQGPVLYLCGEGDGGLGRRFKGIEIKHKPAENLYVIPRSKQLDASYLNKIKALIKHIKPVLIVVDTWNQLSHEVNNNDASEVSIQLALIRQTIYETGIKTAALIVHHYGKDELKGLEGSHAFTSNSDFEFQVKKTTEEDELATCLICKKQKDGDHFKAINIEGEVIDTGIFDEDGKPVRTIVLNKAPPSLAARATSDEPKGKTQKDEVLRAFTAIANEQRATIGRPNAQVVVRLKDVKGWLAINSGMELHNQTISRLIKEGFLEANGRGEYTVIT